MTTDRLSENESGYPPDTLGLEAEEMRRLGYRVVDMVVDRLARKTREAAILTGQADQLRQALGGHLPEQPLNAEESLALLAEVALPHQQRGDHPRYFARVPGPSSFAAVLGEWLGTGFNTIAASWAGGSGPATVELVVIDWLRQLMGLPEGTEGVLVSGGSMASLTAFAVARATVGTGVVYLSDQTHSSLPRALKELGFPPEYIRILESDDQLRMPVESLLAAIAGDRQAGNRPFMVIGTAGTTNAGTVDPLPELADICARENLWFHIDGAYGAPAALTAQGRVYLHGMERADSLVLDPHKWLFQPYDAGCLLIRKGALEQCFNMNPEYLKDVEAGAGEVDFRNRGLELTRRSRALKLWMSLRTYGVARFREAIETGIALAEYAERYLRQQPDKWEVVTPAQIGVVCFALKGKTGEDHKQRVQELADSGFACVSSTVLKGRTVLRLCIINPLTTEDDVRETIDRLGSC
ncbi:pyridoxal phosphate-dependent decarboxylase family protein [Microbulbifer rhizosphaerae]|uniref:Glutamate/tyrosine decarboxylase-like PLP-dependent enzyme n=1 Tax=Microbulbifer rhizosphaerae TaxID=1562603 RepID=A0A7W4WGZ0_9GAMM|nr:aminotransferase class I/II-fold pyridoxal phosphate-dependent enzyme [Microbulbifer rhizosphaerae]MBB3063577.1 glutamate/tyrosine decarboxylase-like PLP-dependent enzyme [Microbulbifer rhizosphaerae]